MEEQCEGGYRREIRRGGAQSGDGDGCRGMHRAGGAAQTGRRGPWLCPPTAQCPFPLLPVQRQSKWDGGQCPPRSVPQFPQDTAISLQGGSPSLPRTGIP